MPRAGRLDAPGVMQHIMIRGIERRNIFRDDTDREEFLARLARLLPETQTACYAWALLPNHVHLLLRTGAAPLPTLMRRLLTGYAVRFNRRHKRHGLLFQNRYKSVVCQEDRYFAELVRYIHLNPLRAKLVADMKELSKYPYCGNSAIMGNVATEWQNTKYVLELFNEKMSLARLRYREFMQKGIDIGRRPDLTGGGLIRSVGGWSAVKSLRKSGAYQKGDERILGDGEFVEKVLSQAEEGYENKYRLKAKGVDVSRIAERVAEITGMTPEAVWTSGKQPQAVLARSILCYWATCELGPGMAEQEAGAFPGSGEPFRNKGASDSITI